MQAVNVRSSSFISHFTSGFIRWGACAVCILGAAYFLKKIWDAYAPNGAQQPPDNSQQPSIIKRIKQLDSKIQGLRVEIVKSLPSPTNPTAIFFDPISLLWDVCKQIAFYLKKADLLTLRQVSKDLRCLTDIELKKLAPLLPFVKQPAENFLFQKEVAYATNAICNFAIFVSDYLFTIHADGSFRKHEINKFGAYQSCAVYNGILQPSCITLSENTKAVCYLNNHPKFENEPSISKPLLIADAILLSFDLGQEILPSKDQLCVQLTAIELMENEIVCWVQKGVKDRNPLFAIRARTDDIFRGGAVVGKNQQWVATFGTKHSCLIWDINRQLNIPPTEEPLRELAHSSRVSCYKTIDDLLILGYHDQSIKVWNLRDGTNLQTYQLDQPILALSYRNRELWVACETKIEIFEF